MLDGHSTLKVEGQLKKQISFFYLIILTTLNLAQSNWSWQNPLPAGSDLTCVKFIEENIGWIVGKAGKIFKTTDGGSNWFLQTSGTTNNLTSVAFADVNRGWVVGEFGIILRTTDGGSNWTAINTTISANLNSIAFIGSTSIWIVGNAGTVASSTNSGNTWTLRTIPLATTDDFKSISVIGTQQYIFLTGGHGKIFKSTNGGSTWSQQDRKSVV